MATKQENTQEDNLIKQWERITTAIISLVLFLATLRFWILVYDNYLLPEVKTCDIKDEQDAVVAQVVVAYSEILSDMDRGDLVISVKNLLSETVTLTTTVSFTPTWLTLDRDVSNLVIFDELSPGEIRSSNLVLVTQTPSESNVFQTIIVDVKAELGYADASISSPDPLALTIKRWLPLPLIGVIPNLRTRLLGLDSKVLSAVVTALTGFFMSFLSAIIVWSVKRSSNTGKIWHRVGSTALCFIRDKAVPEVIGPGFLKDKWG